MKKIIFLVLGLIMLIGASAYVSLKIENREFWKEKIGIITIYGAVSPSGIGRVYMQPDRIINQIDEAEKNPSIKGILFEINSPGGTPVASAEIADRIKRLKKPNVAWIGDMGTSGAYWIASSADIVVAHPASITGSIGAYTTLFGAVELLDKIGISTKTIQSGQYKDIGNPFRNITEEDVRIFEEMINKTHEMFIQEIAKNRNMDIEEVRKIADGKPYLGVEAKELGLVDVLGTKQDAILICAKKAGIKGKPEVVRYKSRDNFFSQGIFESIGRGIGESMFTYLLALVHK